ncbi:Uncharacterised protein [Vibrio cholerae]|nr:Uncharacterised protein [Vibrio cholerae]
MLTIGIDKQRNFNASRSEFFRCRFDTLQLT